MVLSITDALINSETNLANISNPSNKRKVFDDVKTTKRIKKVIETSLPPSLFLGWKPMEDFITRSSGLGFEISILSDGEDEDVELAKVRCVRVKFERLSSVSIPVDRSYDLHLRVLNEEDKGSEKCIYQVCEQSNESNFYAVGFEKIKRTRFLTPVTEKEAQISFNINKIVKENIADFCFKVNLSLEEARQMLAIPPPYLLLRDHKQNSHSLMPLANCNFRKSIFTVADPLRDYRYLRALLFTIALLHEGGFFHGDIKPSNILEQFWSNDEGVKMSRCYLIDFGNAGILSNLKKTGLDLSLEGGSKGYVNMDDRKFLELDLLHSGNVEDFVIYKQRQDCFALATIMEELANSWNISGLNLPFELTSFRTKIQNPDIKEKLFSSIYSEEIEGINMKSKLTSLEMYRSFFY
jgi:hypothetical protein